MSAKAETNGFVIITVAILLVVLLAFAALAIDVGMLFTARTAAQRSADAAALAGAFTFANSPMATQPDAAISRAMDVALNSKIVGDSILAADVNVQVDVPNRRVTVNISHVEGSYFANVIGISSSTIGVQAIAEASKNAIGAFCAKPWFIPNTLLSGKDLCGTVNACTSNEVLILPNGDPNSTFLAGKVGVSDPPLLVKPGNPAAALSPGQFYAVRLGDSTGGADYRTNIATCTPDIISCQKAYPVEPGNMIGPTMQGTLDLIGSPPDTWAGFSDDQEPLFEHPDGSRTTTSRALVVAPIWDVCAMAAYCDAKGKFQLPDNGANVSINVIGFALLFITGVSGNDVQAVLIGVSGCGQAPVVDDDETGPYGVPVRLVRLPQGS